MGGAVSSGRDNTELIDNLMGGNYIRSRDVERAFRALDRGDYMTPEARDQAYKDLAWRNGPLHMSAPCIYSEVMEGLELKPGLSFLNVGSGTGYLSTLVGMILGSNGINHGVEVHPIVVDYANKKLAQFLESSPAMDEFDFCEPKFLCGNGLCLAPLQTHYDRVYCGAGCPEEYQNYFQQLIKVGGILIMPLNDNLLQVKRTGPNEWVTRSLLNVSFATLRVPTKEEQGAVFRLEEQTPARLQALARSVIRECMRGAMRRRNPEVREPPPKAPPAKRACPRRICIPVDDDSDTEGLNALHDLDRASGANEMNALLSLVLSMGHNRVAGALRVDPLDSDSDSHLSSSSHSSSSSSSYDPTAENEHREAGDLDRGSPQLRIVNVNERPRSGDEAEGEDANARPNVRSVLMFEFRDRNGVLRHNPPLALHRNRLRRNRRRRERRQRLRRLQEERQRENNERAEGENEPFFDAEGNEGNINHSAAGDRLIELELETLDNVPEDVEGEATERDQTNDNNVDTNDGDKKEIIIEKKNNEIDANDVIDKDVTSNKEDEETEEKLLKSGDDEVPLHTDETVQDKESTKEDQSSEDTIRPVVNKRREQRYSSRASGSRDKDKVSKSRHRSWTPKSSRRFVEKDDEDKPVPEESQASEKASTSMEWETSDTVEDDVKSDEEETVEVVKAKEEKRQKLDSGIGEENSPSGGSGSHKSGAETEPEPDQSNSCDSDRSDYDEVRGRRRRQKRGHLSTVSSSSTDEDEIERSEDGQYHSRRSRKPRTDHHATRRAALSLCMRQAVKELPLPYALQRYVNLGRSLDI